MRLAVRVRAKTAVTVEWLAERLATGTAGYVKSRVYRSRKGVRP